MGESCGFKTAITIVCYRKGQRVKETSMKLIEDAWGRIKGYECAKRTMNNLKWVKDVVTRYHQSQIKRRSR